MFRFNQVQKDCKLDLNTKEFNDFKGKTLEKMVLKLKNRVGGCIRHPKKYFLGKWIHPPNQKIELADAFTNSKASRLIHLPTQKIESVDASADPRNGLILPTSY